MFPVRNKVVQDLREEWNLLVKYMSNIWNDRVVILFFYGIISFFRIYDLKVLGTSSHNLTKLWTLNRSIMLFTKSVVAQKVKNLFSFHQLKKDVPMLITSLVSSCLRNVDELCCFLYFVLTCQNIECINLSGVMEYIDFILLSHSVLWAMHTYFKNSIKYKF